MLLIIIFYFPPVSRKTREVLWILVIRLKLTTCMYVISISTEVEKDLLSADAHVHI